jgi:hypothetical protein
MPANPPLILVLSELSSPDGPRRAAYTARSPEMRRFLANGARLYFLSQKDEPLRCVALSESEGQRLGKGIHPLLKRYFPASATRNLFYRPMPRTALDVPASAIGNCEFSDLIQFGLILNHASAMPLVPTSRPLEDNPFIAWLADLREARHLSLHIPRIDEHSQHLQHWYGLLMHELSELLGHNVHLRLAGVSGEDPRCHLVNVIRRR